MWSLGKECRLQRAHSKCLPKLISESIKGWAPHPTPQKKQKTKNKTKNKTKKTTKPINSNKPQNKTPLSKVNVTSLGNQVSFMLTKEEEEPGLEGSGTSNV